MGFKRKTSFNIGYSPRNTHGTQNTLERDIPSGIQNIPSRSWVTFSVTLEVHNVWGARLNILDTISHLINVA